MQARIVIEDGIHQYFEKRRAEVGEFCRRQFSIDETLRRQKRFLLSDLVRTPLNAVWAIPYFAVRKIVDSLEKLEIAHFASYLTNVPSGIRTCSQAEVEILICGELLGLAHPSKAEWPAKDRLIEELQSHPDLQEIKASLPGLLNIQAELHKELDRFSSASALVSDLATSAMTLGLGWWFFGDESLGVSGIGERIARKMAKDRASSHFFLGRNVGNAFYSVFPPAVSSWQIARATAVVIGFLLIFSWFVGAISDPLRQRLGLQEKRLVSLLNCLEEALYSQLRRNSRAAELAKSEKTDDPI